MTGGVRKRRLSTNDFGGDGTVGSEGNSSVKMANVSVAGTGEGDSAMEVDWDGTGQAVSPKNDVTPRDFQNEVFSNDLIVAKIISHLSVKDLIGFRCLAKVWDKEGVKEIRKNHKLIRFDLHNQSCAHHNADRLKDTRVVEGPEEMERFIGVIEKSSSNVFTRFGIYGSDLCHPLVVQFLEMYGRLIEFMEVEWGRGDLTQLSSFRELILFAVPNLKSLRLVDVPVCWAAATEIFPAYLGDIKLPKLKEIDMQIPQMKQEHFRSAYKLLQGLLKVAPNVVSVPYLRLGGATEVQYSILETFAELPSGNVLKALDFISYNSLVYDLMSSMTSKNLFIQTMHFNLWDLAKTPNPARQSETIDAIEAIIRDQKFHLKHLRLQVTAQHRPFINLPTLPHLLSLKVVRSDYYQVVPNICYGNDLPNLKELCIVGGKKGFGSKLCSVLPIPNNLKPNLALERLELIGHIETAYAINRAASIFPNVKRLSLTKLFESAYPALWCSWPNLEECYIKQVFITHVDHFFTGIPVKTCLSIQRELACPDRAERWFSNSVSFHSNISPTITRWKKLRKLYLNYTKVNRAERIKDMESHKFISDTTGCMAFSKMKSLRELVIGYCRISPNCTQILTSKLDLVKISRASTDDSSSYSSSSEEEEYAYVDYE